MRYVLAILAAVLLALAPIAALPAHAKVSNTVIMKTATGSAQRVTTDTTIYTRKITVQSKIGNSATVYVGDSSVTSSNFMASLAAGQGVTFTVSYQLGMQGELYELSDLYVLGTASDTIAIYYEVQS